MAVEVLGHQRRLEEPGPPFVERPAQAQRVGQVVRPVGVDGDAQVRVRCGDRVVGGEVGVDAVPEVQLDGAYPFFGPVGGEPRAFGVGRLGQAGDVGGHLGAERTAEQGVHGCAVRLAGEVPQRDVHGGERVGLVSDEVPAFAHEAGQP